jgi:anti-anti-sigma factor
MPTNGESFPSETPFRPVGRARFDADLGETFVRGNLVRLAGELDLVIAGRVRRRLSSVAVMPGDRLVVDVSGVTFMDASGLRVLVAARQRLVAAGGGGLVVRGAAGIVRRLFELTGLTALLDDPEPVRSGSCVAADGDPGALELARRDAGLSIAELYVAYFALGGAADRGHLVAYLNGDTNALDLHQQDVAVHAVNERLADVGHSDRLLSYASA